MTEDSPEIRGHEDPRRALRKKGKRREGAYMVAKCGGRWMAPVKVPRTADGDEARRRTVDGDEAGESEREGEV